MATADIDGYFAGVGEPGRSTLEEVRRRILEVVPHAEQGLSYAVPAFRIQGKVIAGLAAFKRHLSYLPHSGSVLSASADALADFDRTKGALHFPLDQPLSRDLVRQLLEERMRQAGVI